MIPVGRGSALAHHAPDPAPLHPQARVRGAGRHGLRARARRLRHRPGAKARTARRGSCRSSSARTSTCGAPAARTASRPGWTASWSAACSASTLGRTFSIESMFSQRSDASKIAFAALVAFGREHASSCSTASSTSPHLASLGGRLVPARSSSGISRALAAARDRDWRFGPRRLGAAGLHAPQRAKTRPPCTSPPTFASTTPRRCARSCARTPSRRWSRSSTARRSRPTCRSWSTTRATRAGPARSRGPRQPAVAHARGTGRAGDLQRPARLRLAGLVHRRGERADLELRRRARLRPRARCSRARRRARRAATPDRRHEARLAQPWRMEASRRSTSRA